MDGSPGENTSAKYLHNIVWMWLAVALNMATGLVISPYVIRKLGPEGYGIWALLFAVISYYGLIDFGVRSALVHYSALYKAQGNIRKVSELVSTVFAYYALGSLILLAIAIPLSRNIGQILNISPRFQEDFGTLMIVVCISILLTNIMPGVLEGLQRFEFGSRVYTTVLLVRAGGTIILLYTGHGILALGLNYVAAQILGTLLCYWGVRRALPELELSWKLVRPSMFREIFSYAGHNFVAAVAGQVSDQSTPILIGLFLPAAFIGYFSFPMRLIQYAGDFISRVGSVATSRAAELTGARKEEKVVALAQYSNRYCLALFFPVAIFLAVWGRELLGVWVGAEFAEHSTPLLPVFLLGGLLTLAPQKTTGSVLIGMGKHRTYSRGLIVESIVIVSGIFLLTPIYGIFGAAVAAVIPAVVMRGFMAPWLLCRYLDANYLGFMLQILVRPALTAVPVAALAWFCQRTYFPGTSWFQLLPAAAATAALYWAIGYFSILEDSHRDVLNGYAARMVRGRFAIATSTGS